LVFHGFSFGCCTHTVQNRNGRIYYRCYEFTYQLLSEKTVRVKKINQPGPGDLFNT
jgi:hypothetical protein